MGGRNKNSSRTLQQKFPELHIKIGLEANSNENIYKHQKYYIDRLIGVLIQHQEFLKTMFNEPLIKNLSTLETHYNDTDPTFIKIIQIYQKFSTQKLQEEDQRYNVIKLKSIYGNTFANYIENLIFAEFLSQLFGIGESNNLIINNSVYSLYVVSMGEDQRKGVDLVVKNQAGEYIGIDITKKRVGKESGINAIQNDPYKSKIIFNYYFCRQSFKKFFKKYMEYIFNNTKYPEPKYIEQRKTIQEDFSLCIKAYGENFQKYL